MFTWKADKNFWEWHYLWVPHRIQMFKNCFFYMKMSEHKPLPKEPQAEEIMLGWKICWQEGHEQWHLQWCSEIFLFHRSMMMKLLICISSQIWVMDEVACRRCKPASSNNHDAHPKYLIRITDSALFKSATRIYKIQPIVVPKMFFFLPALFVECAKGDGDGKDVWRYRMSHW